MRLLSGNHTHVVFDTQHSFGVVSQSQLGEPERVRRTEQLWVGNVSNLTVDCGGESYAHSEVGVKVAQRGRGICGGAFTSNSDVDIVVSWDGQMLTVLSCKGTARPTLLF